MNKLQPSITPPKSQADFKWTMFYKYSINELRANELQCSITQQRSKRFSEILKNSQKIFQFASTMAYWTYIKFFQVSTGQCQCVCLSREIQRKLVKKRENAISLISREIRWKHREDNEHASSKFVLVPSVSQRKEITQSVMARLMAYGPPHTPPHHNTQFDLNT